MNLDNELQNDTCVSCLTATSAHSCSHCSDATWTLWCLGSPVKPLLVKQLVHASNKENIKVFTLLALSEGLHWSYQWHNGPVMRKTFACHGVVMLTSISMMTSSNGKIFRVTGPSGCAGNSPVPVNSPHKGQWRGDLMFSLICVWINGWVNNREAGDLRRNRGRYDVMVMPLQETIWDFINLWWPNHAIWLHRSWSTLVQVMTCCLTAPSHCPNQLILTNHQRGSVALT